MLTHKHLIVLVIALFIAFYSYCYTRVPHVVQIIQVSLSQLKPSHLLEKQPIVISEPIVDPMSLIDSVFKFISFSPKTAAHKTGHKLTQTDSRYTLISCKQEGLVDVFHPKFTNVMNTPRAEFITFKLAPSQVLILPKKWWYQVKGDCTIIRLSGF